MYDIMYPCVNTQKNIYILCTTYLSHHSLPEARIWGYEGHRGRGGQHGVFLVSWEKKQEKRLQFWDILEFVQLTDA